MPVNLTNNRLEEFMAALKEAGGSSGNGALRQRLGWEEDIYWKAQGRLIEQGRLVPGRGRGGSVRFTEAHVIKSGSAATARPPVAEGVVAGNKERDLYPPLKAAIESKWINKFGFDEVIVEETHSRGSKDTGGTFTRPDITAAGIRRYVYLPKRLEIITFEIKPAEAVSIMAVLEAIAHREAAHRSYVIYSTSRANFDDSVEAERLLELSQKYEIGVVLAERPGSVETWEILLDAVRHEPDPARLERFLGDLPSDSMKKQLSKWKE
jgi:hypothetical protein